MNRIMSKANVMFIHLFWYKKYFLVFSTYIYKLKYLLILGIYLFFIQILLSKCAFERVAT